MCAVTPKLVCIINRRLQRILPLLSQQLCESTLGDCCELHNRECVEWHVTLSNAWSCICILPRDCADEGCLIPRMLAGLFCKWSSELFFFPKWATELEELEESLLGKKVKNHWPPSSVCWLSVATPAFALQLKQCRPESPFQHAAQFQVGIWTCLGWKERLVYLPGSCVQCCISLCLPLTSMFCSAVLCLMGTSF